MTASPSLKVKTIWLTGVILVMVYLSPPSLETSNFGLAFTSAVYLSPLLPIFQDSKFYPKKSFPDLTVKVIHRNKSGKNFYPEVLSKKLFIQNVRDLFYLTLSMKTIIIYIKSSSKDS